MSHKKLFVLFLVPALLLFTGYSVWALTRNDKPTNETATTQASNDSSASPSADPQIANPDTPVSNDQSRTVTRDEVARHSTADDCWTIINDNVYDLTSYIPRHPGGDDILAACGTDGSSLFNERKTESGESVGSGTPHSSRAQSQLEPLLVGQLAN